MDFLSRLLEFLNLSQVDLINRNSIGESKEDIYSILKETDATANKSSFEDFQNAKAFLEQGLLSNGIKPFVYGDYDVDGLTSTSIMVLTLRLLGFKQTGFYIPSRYDTGYGLNTSILSQALSKGYNFFIAVDNGITKKKECDFLSKNNVRYLILDHHEEQKGTLPTFGEGGQMYHRNDVSAAFLALLMSHTLLSDHAFFKELEKKGYSAPNSALLTCFSDYFEFLASLAVFSDCMNLSNRHNLALAKIGLHNINQHLVKDELGYFSRFLDLISKYVPGHEVTFHDINYSINSKLNAVARVFGGMTTNIGAFFMMTNNPAKVKKFLFEIEKANETKKKWVTTALRDNHLLSLKNYDVLDFSASDIPSGLSGLIANAYMNSLDVKRVVLVLCPSQINRKEVIGSLRGPEGLALDKVLNSPYIKPFLKDHGGHEAACGFTLPLGFKNTFLDTFDTQLVNTFQVKVKKMVITPEEVCLNSLKALHTLEPFGMGFEEPKFALSLPKSLLANSIIKNHILLNTANGEGKIVLFNQANKLETMDSEMVEVVGSLSENNFNGKISCQLIGTIAGGKKE